MKQKKTTPKKLVSKNSVAAKPVAADAQAKTSPRFNAWSLSIYVYWFIILFFISATFYILGRSHGILHPMNDAGNVEITEEMLMQSNDYLDAGKAKLMAGDVNGAITDFTVAIDVDMPTSDSFVYRGEAYMLTGNYREAMTDFDRAVEIDNSNSIAYYDRSLLYTRMEDYAAALADINNALAASAVNPNLALQLRDIYAKRGQLNLWLKNWDGAVADFTNSLSRPEGAVNPSVYADRAEAYTALNRYGEAINDYMSAVRVISEQIQGAATAEEREGLSRDALTYFEKSAALNVQMGNTAAAKTDLESAQTIAIALNDAETVERINGLLTEFQ